MRSVDTYNTKMEFLKRTRGTAYTTAAEGRTYAANSLNQYTAIDTFEPEYDADGNQTRVLTSTGEWTVEYNAENRPVRWTQDGIVITMAYDRMGRRVEYRETRDGAHYMHAKYVYDGYLCVQRLYGEHEMPIRAAQLNSAYDTALTLLSRSGGHNAAKFQKGGGAFVEAEFVE